MIIAAYNLKGGVGKTAAAVNLGFVAARDSVRTLLWDLDPQGAATYHFRIAAHLPGGAKALARRESDLAEAIRGTDYERLDLLPADFRLRKLDALLDMEGGGRKRLRQALAPVRSDYDLVLLDCPPSIGRTLESVFALADFLLVPLIPTPLSVRTLDQLVDFGLPSELNQGLLPFFSMVDRRKSVHREIMEGLPARYPQLLTASIPHAAEVERMSLERRPVGAFAAGSTADLAYHALWQELKGRIGWP